MFDIPPKTHDFEVIPSNNSSLSKRYTIKVGYKYYDITETLYQLLELIDNKRTLTELSKLFSQATGKTYSISDLANIIDNHLVKRNIVFYDDTPKNIEKNESYLLIKLPFLNNKIIEPIASLLKIFYQKHIIYIILLCSLLFHIYLYFFFNKPVPFSFTDLKATELFLVYLILFITTFFHELGHSSACAYIGAKFGSIGIGLYLNMPVFYADVTDIWTFKRYKRLFVDFGGIYFQLISIFFIFLTYLFIGNSIFLIAIYLLNFSIVFSLNPILRFDGYWIATDISGIPNLRKRSKEIFYYYIKKIYKSNIKAPFFLNDIPKSSKYFLIVYSLLSNVLFSIYIYIIIIYIPTLFSNFLLLINELILFFNNNSLFDNYTNLLSILNRLLPSFLFVSMLVILFFRVFKKFINLIYRNKKLKLAHGAKPIEQIPYRDSRRKIID